MSFITKRERVFNEYDLFDLPARNEGKLKAYASCTDARAWSHFCSDKTEHLVEIIKRNNETCRPKYVPTDVIVNTLMVAKNAEISRLKRKIEEFEQMIAAYDQLELTCDQKCEIANAHAAIKAANKELDELCLDLDLSGFTEGIDSEAFETGKSRGDEVSRLTVETEKSRGDEWPVERGHIKMEAKSNQTLQSCPCDASTIAIDPRIEELEETIICKDAKLNAMKNTIAVMENDVCEPYCVYANIYTALEKIFGILCQNKKYKHYLDLLAAGKDTRHVDLKGKIIYKIKLLEKFCLALIAPCNQDYNNASPQECSCKDTKIIAHVETEFAITSEKSMQPSLDVKRAQLVADIIDNQEMKEILQEDRKQVIDEDNNDNFSIDAENINRLKTLQANYDDLLTCYDNLKYERDCLVIRCQKVGDLENECGCLQDRLREYNQLWNENEYFKKRSEDLDKLKETYYILLEETSNMETKLKAEIEINKIKSDNLNELREENIALDKKLHEMSLEYEKERNSLTCHLKECECKIMCQEQQIKSLSMQIDKFLEQSCNKIPTNEEVTQTMELINKVELQKEQIKNLTHACFCNEEEKNLIQQEFEKKLEVINQLKMEIELWKSKYQEKCENNDFLQKYTEKCEARLEELDDVNKQLSQNIEDQNSAIDNLYQMLKMKSQEINHLNNKIEKKEIEIENLLKQIKKIEKKYNDSIESFHNEQKIAVNTLQLSRQESIELLRSVQNNDSFSEDLQNSKTYINYEMPQSVLQNSDFLNEVDLIRKENISTIRALKENNEHYKKTLEVIEKESTILKNKLETFEQITKECDALKFSYDKLAKEKESLEHIFYNQAHELNNLRDSLQITKKKSEDLLQRLQDSELSKEEYVILNGKLQNDVKNKDMKINNLLMTVENLNDQLLYESKRIVDLEQELFNLKKDYDKLNAEKISLQQDFDNKADEFANLYDELEKKVEENKKLNNEMEVYKTSVKSKNDHILNLKAENSDIQINLEAMRKESAAAEDKLNYYRDLESEFDKLKDAYDKMEIENKELQKNVETQRADLYEKEKENDYINKHNYDLQKALESVEKEFISEAASSHYAYSNIKEEIKNLKIEKNQDHEKIKRLMEKITDMEDIILKLTEDVVDKDNKISELQNHINELQNEVRQLHTDLDEVIVTGEEISSNSFEKIDSSVKKIKAHYSKATHNIKMELDRVKGENALLENELSKTRSKSGESFVNKHKYLSQIQHLECERENIIEEIKKLEIKTRGVSDINTANCAIKDIMASLNNIAKCFDERNASLENTLINVQNSYRLLQTKAAEAAAIAENEKQKILAEKEDAKLDQENIKKKLEELKMKLRNQESTYEDIIKDLKGQMLNQKLIFDKIHQANEEHTEKLKDDIKLLQAIYDDSKMKINEYQKETQSLSESNSEFKKMLEELQNQFTQKSREVEDLQTILHLIENKPTQDFGFQVTVTKSEVDQFVQTGSSLLRDVLQNTSKNQTYRLRDSFTDNATKDITDMGSSNAITYNKSHSINEVQILTANVEPSLDFVRNAYLNYKIKRLKPGTLEQYSFSSLEPITKSEKDDLHYHGNDISRNFSDVKTTNVLDDALNCSEDVDFIDIYRTKNNTETSNLDNIVVKTTDSPNQNFEKKDTKIDLPSQNIDTYQISDTKNKFQESISANSTDKDLFIIYTDSDNNNSDKKSGIDTLETESAIFASKSNKHDKINIDINSYHNKNNFKPKLKIKMPRVDTESQSAITTSEEDKRSLDSYNLETFTASKHMTYSETNVTNKDIVNEPVSLSIKSTDENNCSTLVQKTPEIKVNMKTGLSKPKIESKFLKIANKESIQERKNKQLEDSQYIQSRLLHSEQELQSLPTHVIFRKDKNNTSSIVNKSRNSYSKSNKNFDSEKNDIQKINENTHDIKIIRNSKSDETFYSNSGSNCSKPYNLGNLTSEEKNNNINSIQNNVKYYTDRSILVKLDSVEDYENEIKCLKKTLETIEKDYKKKLDAIKIQYDMNVKSIINEHNQGVASMQSLHEETLHDMRKIRDTEIENLRTMSIEAMRKAETLETENIGLKMKLFKTNGIGEETPKTYSHEQKRKRCRTRDAKMLTKTEIEAFNLKPNQKLHGPCTCSLDVNVSDTIRNIFEQVDVDQRKLAESTYLKYIANKLQNCNLEKLDAQELSFLHLKVCRLWKTKLNKEEAFQMKINSLETDIMKKHRQAQKHMADLDRQVAEERRRLQQVREAVCRTTPDPSREGSPTPLMVQLPNTAETDGCNCPDYEMNIKERLSAGDLMPERSSIYGQPRRKIEHSRAVIAQLDVDDHVKKIINETPTRLRKSHDKQRRIYKK